MVVPNGPVLASLEKILPAFYGSLFILFTAGILVAIMVSLPVLAWMRTAYPVGPARQVRQEFNGQKKGLYYGFVFFLAFLISGIALAVFADSAIFHKTRDFLLTSNAPGTALTQFYYTYSPYANHAVNQQIPAPGHVWWVNIGVVVRFLCTAGLFAGLPLFCFGGLFLSVFSACKRILPGKIAILVTGILVTGFTLGMLTYLSRPEPLGKIATAVPDIEQGIASQTTKKRVETLQFLYQRGQDIWQFPEYCKTAVKSDSIAERYWLTKAFSKSDTKKSLPFVKGLVADDAIHVRTAAIKALSRLSCDKKTRYLFEHLMKTSPFWYVQNAAYKAFKECP